MIEIVLPSVDANPGTATLGNRVIVFHYSVGVASIAKIKLPGIPAAIRGGFWPFDHVFVTQRSTAAPTTDRCMFIVAQPQTLIERLRSPLAVKSGLVSYFSMSSVQEIETAVRKLSRQELLAFRDWFSGFDAAAWDKQFEEDVAAGHLDALADEAIRDSREGRCRDL